MEILAAVFVIAIGLMGIIMVIPFGTYHLTRMNRADFSGNCGRAAMAELKVRGWSNDPYEFLLETDQTHILGPSYNLSNLDGSYTVALPASADPIMCISTIPFIIDPLNAESNNITVPAQDHILRFVQNASIPGEFADIDAFKDRFVWSDDIPYVPGDGNSRPVMTDTQAKSNGYYTWFFMLTPNIASEATAKHPAVFGSSTTNINRAYVDYSDVASFDVDVIVSQRRGYLSDNSDERAARVLPVINFNGNGKSGGSITVKAPDEAAVNFENYKNVDWVLLSGRYKENNLPPGVVVNQNDCRAYAKWFRLISKGEPDLANFERKLMLLGPDIPVNDLDTSTLKVHLFEGVAHVYSDTVPKKL